jgi:serine/threonine-protein kinase
VIEGLSAALADRYRLERELGQGGMAMVYLAEDLKHRRKVAVKGSSRPPSISRR